MNKRKWKKKYKKEHGNNPPSKKQVKRWMEELPQKIKYTVNTVKEIVNKACKIAEDLAEELKTMPEDAFEDRIKRLTPEQQKLARKIRGNDGR